MGDHLQTSNHFIFIPPALELNSPMKTLQMEHTMVLKSQLVCAEKTPQAQKGPQTVNPLQSSCLLLGAAWPVAPLMETRCEKKTADRATVSGRLPFPLENSGPQRAMQVSHPNSRMSVFWRCWTVCSHKDRNYKITCNISLCLFLCRWSVAQIL